ncbi:PREDICTED: centromere protein O, partial [Merops nubicus]|uniref:centromere protein O n=1 Tax=Merops nubicus TaxID=57421 RepID=UPI0004F00F2A
ISGKLTKQGVCFCLSTAFEGTYLESFHLELVGQPRVRVGQHSLPPFLPLEQLASKFLPTDPRQFLSHLFDHLNAYAGRKFQADQLQEHFSEQLEGTLQRNSLCNLLVFSYTLSGKGQSFPLRARLLYGDLC